MLSTILGWIALRIIAGAIAADGDVARVPRAVPPPRHAVIAAALVRPPELATIPMILPARAKNPMWRRAKAVSNASQPLPIAPLAAAPTPPACLPERPDTGIVPFAPAVRRKTGSRWQASAYVYVRPGARRESLAAGGQLGGSQAAARLTYRLNQDGPVRTALAGRVYAPLSGKGAEAAVGLDWHPLRETALRLSIERRVRLDRQGRHAWSAYAAGGFYKEPLAGVLVVDGYAQAGIVGAHRRDLFVDGALRTGRRLASGGGTVVLGAGLWGAAQPGASRLDVGPRIGVTVPLNDRTLSIALEGRLRIAGRASPGSGAALTLAVDF